MIKRLIWTTWTPMSSVLKKADKLNLSLSLFLPQSNNLEMVSILSEWVNTDLMDDRRFYWNTTPGKSFTTDASVFR